MNCFFDVHVEMAFVLTSTIQFDIWTLSKLYGMLCIYVVKNKGQFTYCKCKVASLLRFAHVGMRICEDAQLLSGTHLVDHTSLLLISHVNLIGQRSLSRG